MTRKKTLTEKRNYAVLNVKMAKEIASIWLKKTGLDSAIEFGLPEVDDRYHIWRVPLVNKIRSKKALGEVIIDAQT